MARQADPSWRATQIFEPSRWLLSIRMMMRDVVKAIALLASLEQEHGNA